MSAITCDDVSARLTEYQEAALPAEEAQRVTQHLAHCPACAQLGEELRQTQALLRRSSTKIPAPDALKSALRSALQSHTPPAPSEDHS